MKKAPTMYKLHDLLHYGNCCENIAEISTNGRTHWVVARPLGYFSIRNRIKYAWMTFTGMTTVAR